MTVKLLSASALAHTGDFARTVYFVVVDNDVTPEDVLRPGFWAHHVPRLTRFDKVEIVRADGTMEMEVRVMGKSVGMVNVREIRRWEDPEAAAQLVSVRQEIARANAGEPERQAPPDYKIGYIPKGPNSGYTVTYGPTGERIGPSHAMKAAAINAAIDHAKRAGNPLAPEAVEDEKEAAA